MARDLVHRIAAFPSIAQTTVATNTTTNGAGVDTLGYDSVTLIAQILVYTAGGTHAFKLQSSPDNATWTDLGSASVQTVGGVTTVTAPNNQVIGGVNAVSLAAIGIAMLGALEWQRYVRAVDQNSANGTSAVVLAMILLGYPRHTGAAV